MISFQVEAWRDCWQEIAPIWRGHYEEIAADQDRIPLDPDYQKYEALANAGKLHIVVVRNDGAVVGYLFALVEPHIHYRSTLVSLFDIYYLKPEFRKGWNGVRLFKVAEKTLLARGVKKMFTGTKLWKDVGPIFERLGWTEAERLFSKYIGD